MPVTDLKKAMCRRCVSAACESLTWDSVDETAWSKKGYVACPASKALLYRRSKGVPDFCKHPNEHLALEVEDERLCQ